MTPTKILVGQILIVFAVVIGGLWVATQWAAAELAYQPRLGLPWFTLLSVPVYYPWRLFEWWYAYDAYAPTTFNEAGTIAASGGLFGWAAVRAIIGSLWRARQRSPSSPPTDRRAGPPGLRSNGPDSSTPQACFSDGLEIATSGTMGLSM